ncbi:hypothetical protein GF402_07240 [Candidatus Fermentibacteria bacterium]|nr:hypothetical protein [Candidatus Fermentibacteria bacterium]
MSTKKLLLLLAVSILLLTALGLLGLRPPWPGAGDPGKLRQPDYASPAVR